jgi:hypothetical protein
MRSYIWKFLLPTARICGQLQCGIGRQRSVSCAVGTSILWTTSVREQEHMMRVGVK